ncbi:MAG: hypothetical protein RL734_1238 [Bacteroidota bacterium]|jgi:uncharacterized protein (TIGR02145 family)
MSDFFFLLAILMTLLLSPGCETESHLHIKTHEKEGTISIGEQTWMMNHLMKTHFNNGDSIPQAQTDIAWKKAGESKMPAWCYVEGTNKEYMLYNWYAISDPRGLIPKGWHLPSYEEMQYLIKLLYTLNHLKESEYDLNTAYPLGNRHLMYYKPEIDVRYSFPVKYSGQRFGNGTLTKLDTLCVGWTSETPEDSSGYIPCFVQVNDKKQLFSMAAHPANGISVRCIKND